MRTIIHIQQVAQLSQRDRATA